MKRTLLLVVLATAMTGCYHASYKTKHPMGAQHTSNGATWIAGLVGEHVVDTRADCPQGLASVHVYRSFMDSLFSGLTAGIYTPMSVDYACIAGAQAGKVSASSSVANAEVVK